MMRTLSLIAALLCAAGAVLGAVTWFVMGPDAEIPVHMGIDGSVNRTGTRMEAALLLPIIMAVLSVIFAVVPYIDPRGKNLSKSMAPLAIGWLGSLVLLLGIQALFLAFAAGWTSPETMGETGPRGVLVAMGVLFALLGNVLTKARPNFFVGVRTPWTLTSDLSWEKTHRLAGRLFVVLGLFALGAAVFAPVNVAMVGVVGGSLATAGISVVYSFFVWRSDPARLEGPQPVDEEG